MEKMKKEKWTASKMQINKRKKVRKLTKRRRNHQEWEKRDHIFKHDFEKYNDWEKRRRHQ